MTIGKKISDLTAVGALTGTEVVEIEQSSSSKKGTVGLFAILALPNTFTGAVSFTSGEIRMVSGTGFLSGYNNANSVRSGFLQFRDTTNSALSVEIAQGLDIYTNATIRLGISSTGNFDFKTGTALFGGKLTTAASAAGAAGLNLPQGAAPAAPTNGDLWTTAAGLFVRINGVTVGPLS